MASASAAAMRSASAAARSASAAAFSASTAASSEASAFSSALAMDSAAVSSSSFFLSSPQPFSTALAESVLPVLECLSPLGARAGLLRLGSALSSTGRERLASRPASRSRKAASLPWYWGLLEGREALLLRGLESAFLEEVFFLTTSRTGPEEAAAGAAALGAPTELSSSRIDC